MADEANRVAPIALPAGSFDAAELEKALDAAVNVKDVEKRPERINKAIVATIEQPEILANSEADAVPFGAEIVDREIVYREGDDPVKAKAIAFKGVDAKSGAEAAKMSYVVDDKDNVVGSTEAPAAVEMAPVSTLGSVAAGVTSPTR